MSSFKIFQLEKNNDDIRKTVLTNTIKMFTERQLLDVNKLDDNIKKVIAMSSDDYLYPIDLNSGKKCIIKIFNQKITGISKQSGISDFLNKYRDTQKLIVVKSITTKASQHVKNNYPNTEVFLENELMINLIDYVLVPKYEVLDRNSDNYKTFYDQYQCKKRQIPKLLVTDPMARYYNLKKNDIVRIIMPSENTGLAPLYRLVI